MDYFSRNVPNKSNLDICLNKLADNYKDFYKEKLESDPFIRLHSSTLGEEEFVALSKAFLEGNITMGNYNNQYENLAKEQFSSKYCVSSNSGSSANLLAIAALIQSGKLKKGDKVIVPVLAWSTTIFPLVQYGLIPVYVDICPRTFNLNPIDVQECISNYDIKAIFLIHTYGNPADMEFFANFCQDHSILLIEDNCESMGASWDGRPLGSFGIMGTLSSYYSHHICTFEGGLTLSKEKNLSDLMKSIRSHGWTRDLDFNLSSESGIEKLDPKFLFLNIGYNLRLSDPQAAMGCVQITKLKLFVEKRIEIANHFIRNIEKSTILSKNIQYQQTLEKGISSWFGFPILFPELNSQKVTELRKYLFSNKVETRPFLAGDFTLQPVNKKFKYLCNNYFPNVKLFHTNSFALPCHQNISGDNVDKICFLIEKFIQLNP